MTRICICDIIERILKTIRRYKVSNHNNKIERVIIKHITNDDIGHNKDINCQMSIKERVTKLIKENEKYFIYEVIRTTADTILYDNRRDMDRLKMLGYSQGIAV